MAGAIPPMAVGTGIPAVYVLVRALDGQLEIGQPVAGTSWTIILPCD